MRYVSVVYSMVQSKRLGGVIASLTCHARLSLHCPAVLHRPQVVNAMFYLFGQRDENMLYLNSFFLSEKLHKGDVKGAQTWLRKKDINIFLKNKVFMMVNIDNRHWILLYIDIDKKVVRIRDSLINWTNTHHPAAHDAYLHHIRE